jgi:hypothetical protein
MDGLSGGSVFPDNRTLRKLRSACYLIENENFPLITYQYRHFPICQKRVQKKQQIFFGFTASCAAVGRRDIQL